MLTTIHIVIAITVGIGIGILAGMLIAKSQKNAIAAKSEFTIAENERLNNEMSQLKQELSEVKENEKNLLADNAVLKSEKKSLIESNEKLLAAKASEYDKALKDQDKRHDEAIKNMKMSFAETIENLKVNLKSATEDMLKLRQEELTSTNKANMKDIVDPLNETIDKMKKAMEGYSKEQSEFSGTMKTNIDTIIKQTETARQSAVELTTALKHDTKVQGDYGETILDELLRKQGFTEGVHYELQYVMRDDNGRELKDDDGKGLRPDVIVHLDESRDVIIDSKINLSDFINFANAETPEDRKIYLEKHVKSIENQVKLLSKKNYFKYDKKTNLRMDYVIMFVPISAAWWEAIRQKPCLWREAMENNVYIADEQTLFAALRIIKLTWTQINQLKSQQEIFNLANEMIDRVWQFMKHYKSIGESLEKAQKAYDSGFDKLTPGGQSILTTTQKLIKLGCSDSNRNSVAGYLAENS